VAPDSRRGTVGDDRGQTTLDFVIAIGIFLLAVAFVFVFMTNMMGPFTQDASQGMVADRVVDAVVSDLTVAADSPTELDETCTVAYFTRVAAGDCPFDVSASLTDQAGVSPLVDVNVTIGHPVAGGPGLDVLCTDGVSIEPCSGDGQRLQVGPPVPESASTTIATARRSVVIDGRIAVVDVQVWS